tara:strand:+ start:1029 stop:1253 length:225 start_codon:yes stop_codon:yes gene_type:complete
MNTAKKITIFGVPLFKILSKSENNYRSYKIIFFKFILIGIGCAINGHSDHIHFNIGITKFETMINFSIRRNWLL